MHPRLFHFGHLILPTYGALIAVGIMASLLVCLETARLLSLPTNKIWNLALLGIVVAMGSSIFLRALWGFPHYGFQVSAASRTTEQEFSIFLGSLGLAIAASSIYALLVHLPIRRTADALAPALALGASVASIGCLEAGCDYGTPTHLPWAIVFTSPFAAPGTPLGIPLHPTQVYTSLVDFAIFVLLLGLLRRSHSDGEILGAWLFLQGVCESLLACLRGGQGELFGGRINGTQLIAAIMVPLGGFFWLRRGAAVRETHAG